jgi:hypothetical protein
MAYPSIAISPDSRRLVRDGREESVSVSGVTYIRSFQASDKYDFELHHEFLSSTDISSLLSHYSSNRILTFDFVWPEDGLTYTGMRYGKGGIRTQWVAAGYRDAWVRLVGS